MQLFASLRHGRQFWGGLLLGMLLALLPLRGWAEAAMHMSTPAPQSAAGEASVPPCHAVAAAHDGAMPDEPASGCSLCSLCHGSALCLGDSGIVHDAAATTVPAAVPQGHGPPDLPLPERPPRA
jgi:hypothetical protein